MCTTLSHCLQSWAGAIHVTCGVLVAFCLSITRGTRFSRYCSVPVSVYVCVSFKSLYEVCVCVHVSVCVSVSLCVCVCVCVL